MGTRELLNVQATIKHPNHIIQNQGRAFKYEIGALEAVSLVGQFNVPELFTRRIKKFKDFERNGVQWGSYGVRIHGSLGQLVDLLARDPDSRQAVLTVYDSTRDLNRGEPDIPCTIALQFLLRDGRLNMRVIMRSNDLWLGFPYDTIQFFALQAAVAAALNVPIGEYVHSVGSLHLYERDFEAASKVMPPLGQDFWKDMVVFAYPIWWGSTIADISSRARDIALGTHKGDTSFESWLYDRLHS